MSSRLTLIMAAACLLAAVCQAQAQDLTAYDNAAFNFRFTPQRGWVLTESSSPDCRLTLEAAKTPDCRLRICISQPRPDILLTQNAYVACENIKLYIKDQLKGLNPACFTGRIGERLAYDAMYLRRVQDGDKVRMQLVNHLFVPLPGRLVQVMAYSLGDTEDEARAVFEAHQGEISRMMASIWMRGKGGPGTK